MTVRDPRSAAAATLMREGSLLTELGTRFAEAGHEFALVGGSVRDALLDRLGPHDDLDFTTSARPEEIQEVLAGWADSVWDVGIAFGTVGARKGDRILEITTYRSESYQRDSRKPAVEFGDSLDVDLSRRDFTINALAVRLPTLAFVDLFDGIQDLEDRIIRTPIPATVLFDDDPLRMMRAARFASQLGFAVADDVVAAMTDMAERITIVSAERIRDEFSKTILGAYPRLGLELLVNTGIADYVLPELPMLKLEIDEHHHHKDVYEHTLTVLDQAIALEETHQPESGPDEVLRLAALLHDIGKPKTRRFEKDGGVSFHHHEVVGARMSKKRLKAMRYSNETIDEVSRLVELHLRFHGYGTGQWTDSAVRRYVRDAGPLLARLHKLTRADCTTRNARRAAALDRAYNDLEDRIERLAAEEELAAIRPDLNGQQIMEILDVPSGPIVGEAYKYLLELRLDNGPMSEEDARTALMAWWEQKRG